MRKVPFGWTKETLGECAKVHMEQITNAHYNYTGEYREQVIKGLIESYFDIECAIGRGESFKTGVLMQMDGGRNEDSCGNGYYA